MTSELVKFQQGVNTIIKSVIADEIVQQLFKSELLRDLKVEDRCPMVKKGFCYRINALLEFYEF